MISKIVTLLCFGLVTAIQPSPSQPSDLKMHNCLAGECPLDYYTGVWQVKFADPSMYQSSGCKRLFYTISSYENYAGDKTRQEYEKQKMNPDQYREISIAETCGGNDLLFLRATGRPKYQGVAFEALITSAITGDFQVEKVWTLDGKVVAAAVQHPLVTTSRKAQTYQGAFSLWYKGRDVNKAVNLAFLKLVTTRV